MMIFILLEPILHILNREAQENPFTYQMTLMQLELMDKPDMVAFVSSHADTLRHAATQYVHFPLLLPRRYC